VKSEVFKKLYIDTSYIVTDIKRKDSIMAAIPSIDGAKRKAKTGEIGLPSHAAVIANNNYSPSKIKLFNTDGSAKTQGQNIYS